MDNNLSFLMLWLHNLTIGFWMDRQVSERGRVELKFDSSIS